MARIKIELPASLAFNFRTIVPVRITDINYGGHAGNDAILSIIHETRMQFLHQFGYTEMNVEHAGLIMADVAIEFKKELFYNDQVICHAAAGDFSRIGFDIYYKLEKEENGKSLTAVLAKTGMICYDYQEKKLVAVPAVAKEKMTQG
ncbi:MAG TPA: thioesterase family protein [Chitinophagaceae bacterium]|nr:thioesterase family protein [Chitinophagaceae bacterium]